MLLTNGKRGLKYRQKAFDKFNKNIAMLNKVAYTLLEIW
jgi:hypothetical protein